MPIIAGRYRLCSENDLYPLTLGNGFKVGAFDGQEFDKAHPSKSCRVQIPKKIWVEISKKDFLAYEKVRQSGVTNMYLVKKVSRLAKISQNKVMAILKNYVSFKAVFIGVQNG